MDRSRWELEDEDDMPESCDYCPILSRKRNVCRGLKEYLTFDTSKERHKNCPFWVREKEIEQGHK